jgi:hypothetical protein
VAHDTTAGRERVIAALHNVAEHLLAHLDYEEQAITSTLRGWETWPAS